jgi:hypothetical protein
VIASTSFPVHTSFLLSVSLSVLGELLSRGDCLQSLSVSFLLNHWQKDVSYREASENTALARFMPVSFTEEVIINIQGSLEEEAGTALMESWMIINSSFA